MSVQNKGRALGLEIKGRGRRRATRDRRFGVEATHTEEGEPCAAAENSASPAPQAIDALGDVSDKDEPCAVDEVP